MAALKVISQDAQDIALDHDDIAVLLPGDAQLDPQACRTILDAFADHPEAVALYWDVMIEGRRQARPAWSPTRVLSEPGITLPLAIRSSWPRFDRSAPPVELERCLAQSNAQVLHLPTVLSRHVKPPETEARIGVDDPRFESGPRPGTWRRRPSLQGQASTSILIPSAGYTQPGTIGSMVERCLANLGLLNPPPEEVIVIVGDEFQGELPLQSDRLPMRVIHRGAGPFNFSRAINCGLLASRGDLVLMLNDDIEAETTDWLGRMAAHLDDPAIGAVGACLLYPDRTVQHIGVIIDDGYPLHPFRLYRMDDTSAHGGDVAREMISVTGACLLARRRDLLAVGGLSVEFPSSYGDVDLCLRLLRSGLRVVVEPAAALIHHESASRNPIVEKWEWGRFVFRWGEVADPWYHPAFFRPNLPHHRNRNGDHLNPVDANGSWAARSSALELRMHESQIHEFRMRIPPRIHP